MESDNGSNILIGAVGTGSGTTLTSTGGEIFVGGDAVPIVATGLLAGSGNVTITGNADFQSANLAIDLANNDVSDKIAISGTLTATGTNNITLSHLIGRTYTLLTATNGVSKTDFAITNTPLTRQTFNLDSTTSGARILYVTAANTRLTWAPADPANPLDWGDPNARWQGGDSEFIDDDYVVFTSAGAGTVDIVPGGVVVSGMEVQSGAYTFRGGNITGIPNTSVDPSAIGGLIISGGSATFQNVEAKFKQIHIMNGGAVTLAGGRFVTRMPGSPATFGTRIIRNRNTSFGVGYAVPLGDRNRQFDGELRLSLNRYF
ncbi:MAG: hypothetical protein ACRC46_02375 [Thermoguttaceae bacterium]